MSVVYPVAILGKGAVVTYEHCIPHTDDDLDPSVHLCVGVYVAPCSLGAAPDLSILLLSNDRDAGVSSWPEFRQVSPRRGRLSLCDFLRDHMGPHTYPLDLCPVFTGNKDGLRSAMALWFASYIFAYFDFSVKLESNPRENFIWATVECTRLIPQVAHLSLFRLDLAEWAKREHNPDAVNRYFGRDLAK